MALELIGPPFRPKPLTAGPADLGKPLNRELVSYLGFQDHTLADEQLDAALHAGDPTVWKENNGTGAWLDDDRGRAHKPQSNASMWELDPSTTAHVGALPQIPEDPITILLAFRPGLGFLQYFYLGNDAFNHYHYFSMYQGDIVQFSTRAGSTRTIQQTGVAPVNGEYTALVLRHYGQDDTTAEIWLNGAIVKSGSSALSFPGQDAQAFAINGLKFGPSIYFGIAAGTFDAVGLWRRLLTDEEVQTVTADPFAPLRAQRAVSAGGPYATLGIAIPDCYSPHTVENRQPLDHTPGEAGTPVVVARGERIDQAIFELNYNELSLAERSQLRQAWNRGRGTVTPFAFNIAGDAYAEELVVFEDERFGIVEASPVKSTARIRLRVVTPQDYSP